MGPYLLLNPFHQPVLLVLEKCSDLCVCVCVRMCFSTKQKNIFTHLPGMPSEKKQIIFSIELSISDIMYKYSKLTSSW